MQRDDRGLPVGEAAALLGISAPALRKRIKRGSVRAYKVDGEWRVIVQSPAQTERDAGDPGNVTIGEAVAQAARIQHLEDEVTFLRGLVAELTRRVPELPAGSAVSTPDMPAVTTGADSVEAAADRVVAIIGHGRRPWWAFWR